MVFLVTLVFGLMDCTCYQFALVRENNFFSQFLLLYEQFKLFTWNGLWMFKEMLLLGNSFCYSTHAEITIIDLQCLSIAQ